MPPATVPADDQQPRGLEAVHAGHLHVEAHHIRSERGRRLEGAHPIPRFTDDLDALLALQDGAESGPHEILVVDQQHADRDGRHDVVTGMLARTRYPPRSRGPNSIVPPTAPTRSRMPS